MSKINEMISCAEHYESDSSHYGGTSLTMARAAANATFAALPDIKRIVEWVETAEHVHNCPAGTDGTLAPCTCGISEIQSLIRR